MSTAANKSLVRAFVEAWNAKDLDRFDDLMSQSCQLSVGGATMSCSPSATRAIAERWFADQPDRISVVRTEDGIAGFAYHIFCPTGSAMEDRDPRLGV